MNLSVAFAKKPFAWRNAPASDRVVELDNFVAASKRYDYSLHDLFLGGPGGILMNFIMLPPDNSLLLVEIEGPDRAGGLRLFAGQG